MYCIVYGCTDNSYVEFNPFANVDDSSCNNLTVVMAVMNLML